MNTHSVPRSWPVDNKCIRPVETKHVCENLTIYHNIVAGENDWRVQIITTWFAPRNLRRGGGVDWCFYNVVKKYKN
jgi:hypothetical protein